MCQYDGNDDNDEDDDDDDDDDDNDDDDDDDNNGLLNRMFFSLTLESQALYLLFTLTNSLTFSLTPFSNSL